MDANNDRPLRRMRASQEADKPTLNKQAEDILGSLPEEVRPDNLMQRFPHTANRLAENWRRPVAGVREFNGLLIDHRGNRSGFPFEVAMELVTLHDYYVTEVYPQFQGVWDDPGKHRLR